MATPINFLWLSRCRGSNHSQCPSARKEPGIQARACRWLARVAPWRVGRPFPASIPTRMRGAPWRCVCGIRHGRSEAIPFIFNWHPMASSHSQWHPRIRTCPAHARHPSNVWYRCACHPPPTTHPTSGIDAHAKAHLPPTRRPVRSACPVPPTTHPPNVPMCGFLATPLE